MQVSFPVCPQPVSPKRLLTIMANPIPATQSPAATITFNPEQLPIQICPPTKISKETLNRAMLNQLTPVRKFGI